MFDKDDMIMLFEIVIWAIFAIISIGICTIVPVLIIAKIVAVLIAFLF